MMALSEDLQLSFDQKFANYQEERKMPLVTNIERRAIEKTQKENIIKFVQVRFGDIPQSLLENINQIDDISWMCRGIPLPGDVVMTTEAPLGEIAQLDDKKVALGQRLITLRGRF
ncbi:hypothetical protein [Dolichospermum circinale]|uniref:hypothetical protein n=1 Tax=Dolichospermum circinale TaxID=109265 RepID=UPI00232EC6C3|nr:hypothetical protein [Dolichospermum circinale]MDB9450588.1 hypothetical protein [Dolichospermum circinale CS-547]